ncbi:MAG: 3-dehydroquinate synthase [Bacillota bacterium]
MENVQIDLGEKSYIIHIDKGCTKEVGKFLAGSKEKVMVITDTHVDTLYGAKLEEILKDIPYHKIVVKPGENSKSMDTVIKIVSSMLEQGLTRKSRIIAFGGGVVGDLAGFCASIYMRGVPFIQIPTTLLAQVDSSVGGKTGVNLMKYKNSIGAFYQPEAVFIDTDFLASLPYRELLSGIGEVIKYGIIYDYSFFKYIRENIEKLRNLDSSVMMNIIKRCCEIKAQIVSQDEKEEGLRKILNFGHTMGHGLEGITNFQKYTHGEAVIIGMYYETMLARKLNILDNSYFQEIKEFIEKLDIDLEISEYSVFDLLNMMSRDKKNQRGKISFILPTSRGNVEEYLLDRQEIKW